MTDDRERITRLAEMAAPVFRSADQQDRFAGRLEGGGGGFAPVGDQADAGDNDSQRTDCAAGDKSLHKVRPTYHQKIRCQ